MSTVTTIAELEALYDVKVPASVSKETDHLTPLQQRYIEASPFVLVATAGPEGLDCSPRGDAPGFVRIVDERTLQMPDRRGNNRLDSIRNIVVDGRVGLLFLVPGIGVTMRVNGTAILRTDAALCAAFTVQDKVPRSVIEITVHSAYTQCPKALIRSSLWDPSLHRSADELPTVGQIMDEITNGDFDGAAFDAAYPERVRQTIY